METIQVAQSQRTFKAQTASATSFQTTVTLWLTYYDMLAIQSMMIKRFPAKTKLGEPDVPCQKLKAKHLQLQLGHLKKFHDQLGLFFQGLHSTSFQWPLSILPGGSSSLPLSSDAASALRHHNAVARNTIGFHSIIIKLGCLIISNTESKH